MAAKKSTKKTAKKKAPAKKATRKASAGSAKKAAKKAPAKKKAAVKAKSGSAKKTAVKKTATKKAAAKKPAAKKAPTRKASAGSAKKAAAKKASAKPATKAAKETKSKVKEEKSGLETEISTKAKPAKKKTAAEIRREEAAAAMAAALEDDDEEDDDDDEFDPEAFLAASGGKGLIRSHVMRKERVDLHLPVRFRMPRGPLVHSAILLNLSKSGMCLETQTQAEEGSVLRIEIPLPHTSELFAIQAEVIWWNKISGTGKNATHHLGLNFKSMSLAKRTVINNFIQARRDEIVMAKIGLDKFADSAPVAGID